MRMLGAVLISALIVQSQAPPPQTGSASVSGHVFNSATNAPLSDVTVDLVPVLAPQPLIQPTLPVSESIFEGIRQYHSCLVHRRLLPAGMGHFQSMDSQMGTGRYWSPVSRNLPAMHM